MHRPRRRERKDERAEPTIGSYHELFFENVADGVAYCQGIVPQVVPPFGTVSEEQASPMAVWLHVPRRTEARARGCFLYLSEAVRDALERVGRTPRTTGTIGRVALPATAVLVFGHDRLDASGEIRAGSPADRTARRAPSVSRFRDALDEPDAILR
jgi:hypothetical protein